MRTARADGPCSGPSHLAHEAAEALEGARDANLRRDLEEDAALRAHVHLEQPSLVERRVEQHEHALVEDVGPRVGWVALVLLEETLMVIAIEDQGWLPCLVVSLVPKPFPGQA